MSLAVLREVRLYGPLRARFGRSHWLAVESPAEAVHALCMLLAGFREALLSHNGPGYRVLVGEGRATQARTEDTLQLGAGSAAVIRLAPVLHGNKRGGALGIVAGIALLVAAPWLGSVIGGAMGSMSAGLAVGSLVTSGAAMLGKAMILGGVMQLLSPQRKGSGSAAPRETSYTFNGPVNVTSPGGPVPLIFGRMIVGSIVVSSGISTDEYQPTASSNPAAPARPADEPETWLDQVNMP
jgi:predicted phage tail protein